MLKNDSAEIYEEALNKKDFQNYHHFENIYDAYPNFIQKVMGDIDIEAPIKSRGMKQNSQEWFNGEVAEKQTSVIGHLRNFKNQNFILTKKYIK